MNGKLKVAFYWHMHQPDYRDPLTGEFAMPWVLLHATKDYLDMGTILRKYPGVRQTFNFVPSLLDQLADYGSGRARDRYREVSLKPAGELDRSDKTFIVENFFRANREKMIRPMPRFEELLAKRGPTAPDDLAPVLRYFTEHDYLDLQVLFNLAWIDPVLRAEDPELSRTEAKGRGFTEEDKRVVLEKQLEIVNRIVPEYRALAEEGLVELTTSAYYHPILPLLCDTDSARVAMPASPMPDERFTHPEDAAEQIRRAVEAHAGAFGSPPRGFWPPEGSVSPEMAPLVAREGIEWMATDEGILSKSLGRPVRRDNSGNSSDPFIYRPYEYSTPAGPVRMVFRDRYMSDLIGFEYARMDPEAAAADLVARLERIHATTDRPGEHMVNIILDGENAWETYTRDGHDFLGALYTALSGHERLECVTVGEFLSATTECDRLTDLHPGSWINSDYGIWIGHAEDNRAWDLLGRARRALKEAEERGEAGEENLRRAREHIYAAEGSDWFWWFGDQHVTDLDAEFDALFRGHLRRVYEFAGVEAPSELEEPVIGEFRGVRPDAEPTAWISPTLDGELTDYFEWLPAGFVNRPTAGGAMHAGEPGAAAGPVEKLAYGFSPEKLFLRLDLSAPLLDGNGRLRFTVNFTSPAEFRVRGEVRDGELGIKTRAKGEEGGWTDSDLAVEAAAGRVVELAVPLAGLGASEGGVIKLALDIESEGGLERWPPKGYLELSIPEGGYEEDWIV